MYYSGLNQLRVLLSKWIMLGPQLPCLIIPLAQPVSAPEIADIIKARMVHGRSARHEPGRSRGVSYTRITFRRSVIIVT